MQSTPRPLCRATAPQARLLILGDMGLYNARCWPYIEAEVTAAATGSGSSGGSSERGSGDGPIRTAGRDIGPTSSHAAVAPASARNSAAVHGAASCGTGSCGGGGVGERGSVPPPAAYDALLHVGDIAYDLEVRPGMQAGVDLEVRPGMQAGEASRVAAVHPCRPAAPPLSPHAWQLCTTGMVAAPCAAQFA